MNSTTEVEEVEIENTLFDERNRLLQIDFYKWICDKEGLRTFLEDNNLIRSPENTRCNVCGGTVAKRMHRHYWTLRCENQFKNCTYRPRISVRRDSFFAYEEASEGKLNSRLSIEKLLEVLYLWSNKLSMQETSNLTGVVVSPTLQSWYLHTRNVCAFLLENAPLIGGPNRVVHVNEILLADLLKETGKYSKEKDYDHRNSKSKDNEKDGPFILGMQCEITDSKSGKKSKEIRAFSFQKNCIADVVPIIQRNVAIGSQIISDENPSLITLSNLGYSHQTVGKKKSTSGDSTSHFKLMSTAWSQLRFSLTSSHHVNEANVDSHLAEFWWRRTILKGSEFYNILKAIPTVYPLTFPKTESWVVLQTTDADSESFENLETSKKCIVQEPIQVHISVDDNIVTQIGKRQIIFNSRSDPQL